MSTTTIPPPRRIYFSTSVSGGRSNIQDARKLIFAIERRVPDALILTKHLVDPEIEELERQWVVGQWKKGSGGSICERDLSLLDSANCLVAEASQSSSGVGAEIYYALYKVGIQVLCLWRMGTHCSPMLAENTHSLLTAQMYQDDVAMQQAVNRFFDDFGRVWSK